MARIAALLSILALLAAALFAANEDWSFSLVGTLAAVLAIIGFAVVAAGWTIRHDV
jgi:uncharacterized membrane protein HdeD (DUF308 family)